MAANAGISIERFYELTIAELYREIKGHWYRVQIEQSNFREVVYTLACIHRDPKRAAPNKRDLWPIPEIDRHTTEQTEAWVDEGVQALEYFKSIGKI